MGATVIVVALLALLCAAPPCSAFLQDLLLQPLQQFQHAVQPHPQQQYYQYQYRRAANDAPPPPPQPVQHGVYSNSRPVLYQQWQQPSPSGSPYSYSSNPFASLLQNSWFPWSANRQPLQQQPLQQQTLQQQQQQPQPLIATQPQQSQQPLQAFWALLPWNSNNNFASGQQQQQGGSPTPVLSFLQNPGALLPWAQQASRPGVVYTSPLAPSPGHGLGHGHPAAISSLQLVAEAPNTPTFIPAPAAAAASVNKPLDEANVQVEDSISIPSSTADLSGNGIRRIALQHIGHEGLPCA